MNDDTKTTLERVQQLEDMVVAQGYFLQEFAFSVFHSARQTPEQYDAAAEKIRARFGVADVSAPSAIKAAARVPGTLAHLDRILSNVRARLAATPPRQD